jgi:hypothetical protein
LSSETITRGRQSTPLGIGEVQALSAQVFFEDAVLFPQIGNHLKLAAIHPPGEGDERDLPSDRVEHPPSLLVTAALAIRLSKVLYTPDLGEKVHEGWRRCSNALEAHDHAPAAGGQSYSVEDMKADLQWLLDTEAATSKS